MKRRDVEGPHPFSREVAEACGSSELGGLLMDDRGRITAAVEAFELEPEEKEGGKHLTDLLREGGFYQDLCAGCRLARQLGVETHLFLKIRGEEEIRQYQVTAEETGGGPVLREVSHARLGEGAFVEWWADHKRTRQTKRYREEFEARARDSYFDRLLEGAGLKWGGNIDGILSAPGADGRAAAILENRYTRRCPIRRYDPGRHFQSDLNTWRPLILLREQLGVPLLLMTYSRRAGEERLAGLAQVTNGPADTDRLRYAPDPAARRPLPPCQRLVTSAEEVKQWLAALL